MNRILTEHRELNKLLLCIILFIGGGYLILHCLKVNIYAQPVAVASPMEIANITGDQWTVVSDHEISYQIPGDFDSHLVLYLNTSLLNFDVYLEDVCILEYRVDSNACSVSALFVPIPGDAAGKTLYLKNFDSADSIAVFQQNTDYLGSCLIVARQYYRDNYYILMHVAVVAVFLCALLFIRAGLKDLLSQQMKESLKSLCIFLVISELWIYTDSSLPAMTSMPVGVILFINYFTVANMPVAFFWFLTRLFQREDKWIRILIAGSEFFILAMIAAWKLKGFQLVTNFWITDIFDALYILLSVCFVVGEYVKKRTAFSLYILIGLGVLGASGIVCCVSYLRNPGSGYLRLFTIGTYIFYTFLAFPIIIGTLDLYDEKRQMDYYRKAAFWDSMTELENRTAFNEKMKYWDEEQQVRPENLCVLMMDVNDLKYVNDHFGHIKGDTLIRSAANCIRDSFSSMGSCYRVGGDEFAVIIENGDRQEVQEAYTLMQEEQKRISLAIDLRVEIALGAAWNDSGNLTVEELLKKADARMYECKRKMKERREGEAFSH